MRDNFLVLVCGSRDWRSQVQIETGLREAAAKAREFGRQMTVITGGASGADQIGEIVARRLGFEVEVVPAQWSTFGRRAGFLRNKQMIEREPDLVLAFQKYGSTGTQHTINLAEAAGIPCWIWRLTFEKVGDVE